MEQAVSEALMSMSAVRYLVVLALGVAAFTASIPAQQPAGINPGLFAEMRWRNIGPHRASRTKAAAGHASQPYTFYMAAVNGGVWKTTDAGRIWKPIFDDQPTGSIGAIAIAPSDPNIIYVGSGEGLQRPDLSTGDGIYKSTDAGRTWTHLGLRDAQQIPQDRRRPAAIPNRLFVAALGHPVRAERGARHLPLDRRRPARSRRCCTRTRTPAATTSTSIRRIPRRVYATMWEERQGPWENARVGGHRTAASSSPTDGGTTWKPLTNGLPVVVQANLAISPANPEAALRRRRRPRQAGSRRRSRRGRDLPHRRRRRDLDADHDRRATAGRIGGGDLPMPILHPKNPDIADRRRASSSWKSTDGGKTWTSFKGAPGGDDYQNIWINPDNPDIILLAADQGAVVTLNGGETWSSWYNQPTGAVLPRDGRQRVSVSRLQRPAGERIGRASRAAATTAQITFRDWIPSASTNTATSPPIRSTPTSSTAAQGDALRSPHRPGVGRRPGRRARRRRWRDRDLPSGAHAAGRLLRGRHARAVLRQQPSLEDGRRRRALDSRSAPT